MKHRSILENKKQYEVALKRIDELMDKESGARTDEGREMQLLLYLEA